MMEDESVACQAEHSLDVNNADSSAPVTQLSKNQQKKQRRQEAARQRHVAKKAEEKAARKASQEKKLAERAQHIAQMTEEERQAWDQQTQGKRQARKQAEKDRKEKMQRALDRGQRIIIDLDFADKMTGAELRSVCKQLAYSYSANTRAAQPGHLILTSYQGVIEEQIQQHVSGFNNWNITKHAHSYLDAFMGHRSDLVYLTADAEEELTELDPSRAYIIGGIVDRNRYKGLCRSRAEAGGIKTARLPIRDYLRLQAAPVMTVNQCVSILVNYLEQRDWQAAFEATVPQRKRAGGSKDSGDLTIQLEEGPQASASAEDGCDNEENVMGHHANTEESKHDAIASAENGCKDEPQAKRPRVEAEKGTAAGLSAEGGIETKETTQFQTEPEAAVNDLRQV